MNFPPLAAILDRRTQTENSFVMLQIFFPCRGRYPNTGRRQKRNKGPGIRKPGKPLSFLQFHSQEGLGGFHLVELIIMKLNTSYLTGSYITFTLKLESGQNFCCNRSIRSSTYGKKIFLKFLHAGSWSFLLLNL